MAKKQVKPTLVQAVHLAYCEKSKPLHRASTAMNGQWTGADGSSNQSYREMVADLPLRAHRQFTVVQWIDAVYLVDAADRYRTRPYAEALKLAAQIEAGAK